MPGLLNKIAKFFKPFVDSLPSIDTVMDVVQKFAPVVGSLASAIPGVGAVAPMIGNLVSAAAGTIGDAYSDYRGGKAESADTAMRVIDTIKDTIGESKTLYKDYKAKKKSASQVKSGPPKKPLLLTKKLINDGLI